MAQAFARLGTRVHLIEAAERVLAREHDEAAALVARALERDGVELHLGSELARVEVSGASRRLHLARGATAPIEVDALLIAVGRAPNVEQLGLEAAGVRFDAREGVEVDDHLRTSNPHVYAAGDVATRFKFTHVADALSRIVLRNALFLGRARASALNVPWCTYTDPEGAHTGMSAPDARERGLELETLRVELASVDRALLDGDVEGFLEVRLQRGKDRILGATLVARRAGELISELSAWMAAGKGLKGLGSVIHPYPTQAVVFKRAGDARARTGLTPLVQSLFPRFLALRRRVGGARDGA
jgi:pyruvate/2-oxoglutarate dehydrogenase complex dihydrolipoamide dehydrogenase (E3) component